MVLPKDPNMKEIGDIGLSTLASWINEAHTAELRWPQCIPLFNRIWRSDPEVTIARNLLSAWASGIEISAEIPVDVISEDDVPISEDDEKARDFLSTVLDDMEGTFSSFIHDSITKIPFFGWGWWEVVPGIRSQDWNPPGDDDWYSQYDDNLIGIRRLGTRRYSSFYEWDLKDNGRVNAFVQQDDMGKTKPIPLDRSIHIVYGDRSNPEGCGVLEGLWRLERIKYGLEIVQGIGYEHSAGHLSVSVTDEGGEFDEAKIKEAARAILQAQPGNYAAWPRGIGADFIDARFGSAEAILYAIRYYGILKLALLGMQFVSISTLTGSGSYAAITDASDIAILIFNNIARGIVAQVNEQMVKRMFQWKTNKDAFPNLTRTPRIAVTEVKKPFDLGEFGALVAVLESVLDMKNADYNAIRKETGFLPQDNTDEGNPEKNQESDPSEPDPLDQAKVYAESNENFSEFSDNGDYPDPIIGFEHVAITDKDIDNAVAAVEDDILKKALDAETTT